MARRVQLGVGCRKREVTAFSIPLWSVNEDEQSVSFMISLEWHLPVPAGSGPSPFLQPVAECLHALWLHPSDSALSSNFGCAQFVRHAWNLQKNGGGLLDTFDGISLMLSFEFLGRAILGCRVYP